MGGSSGGGTVSNNPWVGQQPYLTDIFGQSQNLFNSGVGQEYYPGTTVTPFSQQTQYGLDQMMNTGMHGTPQQGAFGDYLMNTLGQGNVDPNWIASGAGNAMNAMNAGQEYLNALGDPVTLNDSVRAVTHSGGQPFMHQGYLQDTLAREPGNIGETLLGIQGASSIGDAAQVNARTQQQLGGTAGGEFLGSNPYLDNMFDNAAARVSERYNEDILPGIQSQFSLAGRTGGGIGALMQGRAAGDAAQELSSLASDIYAPAYEAERNRQIDAAGALGQIDMSGQQLGQQGGIAALDAATDIYGTDVNQRLGAAGLGGDMYGMQNQNYLDRYRVGADLFNRGQDRQLDAGASLANLGLGGVNTLTDLQGQLGDQTYRAGALTPGYQQMGQTNIDNIMRSGGMIEDQSQRLMDDELNRFNFYQNAPQQALNNYASNIYGMPGNYGQQVTSGGGGSRLAGALGGGMMGYGMGLGPWGAAGGALMGLL